MADRLQLSVRHRRAIEALLREHLPGVEAWAYGSRVNGRSHDGSDLDLVLRGPKLDQIPAEELIDFAEAVRESAIPFLVEARDWARLPEPFHREIERSHVVLQRQSSVCEGWSSAKLGSLVTFLSGGTPSKNAPQYWGGSIPWVSAKDMKCFRLADSRDHITADGAANGTRVVPKGTVLLLARGMTLLNSVPVCVLDRDMAFNQDIKALRPGPAVLSEYLPYLVLGNADRLQTLVDLAGHGTDRLNSEELKAFTVRLPPVDEQRAIAHILGTLDDKIDLIRRENETLEEIARAIFRDWFVDFGPTRAKADGGKPYLPAQLWSLFPDALGDDGKPVGWTTYDLAVLACHHRATFSPIAEPERIYEHYSIPAYDSGNQPSLDIGHSIKSNKTIVPDGAVLLSKLNPDIERVWLPDPAGETPQVASTEFLALTPLAPATRSVLFCLFKSKPFRTQMAAMVTGTSKSHQRVSPRALLATDVMVGDPKTMDAFDQAVRPSIDRLLSNRLEASRLADTRNLLLPKLVSGEIRVPHAEHTVGPSASGRPPKSFLPGQAGRTE